MANEAQRYFAALVCDSWRHVPTPFLRTHDHRVPTLDRGQGSEDEGHGRIAMGRRGSKAKRSTTLVCSRQRKNEFDMLSQGALQNCVWRGLLAHSGRGRCITWLGLLYCRTELAVLPGALAERSPCEQIERCCYRWERQPAV